MKRLLFYSIPLFYFSSCTVKDQSKENDSVPYKVIYKQLQVDTSLREIAYVNGYFVCLQENLQLAVFDSNFIRNKTIEDSINIMSFGSIWSNQSSDTIFLFKDEPNLLGWPKDEYYLTNTFKVQKRKYLVEKSEWPVNSWPLFVDSTYDIYTNIGYHPFQVFFYNKSSKKTYTTWSNGPRQILRFNNKYYLAEEGDYKMSPAFKVISDPTKLIEVSGIDAVKLRQLFQHLSAPPSPLSYYRYLADSIEKSALPSYGSSEKRAYFSIPIYTFIKDTCLYTIIKSDSSIYLVIHQKDSLSKIQTILDTSIEMQRISHRVINNTHFVTFEASGGKMIENKMQNYSFNGFILIRDSSIYFLYHYLHKPYDP